MDVNKGWFEEIFAVVTTVYKSTSPMDFVAVLRRGTTLVCGFTLNQNSDLPLLSY